MIKKYRNTAVVEALQYQREDNIHEVLDFANEFIAYSPIENEYYVRTPAGSVRTSKGDYIIKENLDGFYKFHLCKPDIFEKTYELVEDEDYQEDKSDFYALLFGEYLKHRKEDN